MTYVGKILVIVIMVFAILFLAFSVVTFSTEMNWNVKVKELTSDIQKVQADKARIEGDLSTQKSYVTDARDQLEKAKVKFAADIKDVADQNDRRAREIEQNRKSVEVSLQEVKRAQDEAEARISESTVLRDNLAKVQKQRDEFKLQQTELDQKILLLTRELEVAQSNNKSLRGKVVVLQSSLTKLGQISDPDVIVGAATPPDVEGEVVGVSDNNQIVEISIGSNDGLTVGNELFLYSINPTPEYLGKIQVTHTDVQQSVGRVIGGKTIHGKKIKKGDHVSTKISPRG